MNRRAPTRELPTPTDPVGRMVKFGGSDVHVVTEGEVRIVTEGEVRVVTEGEDLPMLFVHGLPGSVRDWRYLGPALAAQGRRSVRIDLPGFGKSALDAWPALEPENRAAFFCALADRLGIDRFLLAGHSFGGGLALLTAALFPDRVAGLLLINSIGTVRHRGLAPVQGRTLRFLPPLLLHNPLLRRHTISEALVRFTRWGYDRAGFKGEFSAAQLSYHAHLANRLDFAQLRWAARNLRSPALVFSTDDDPMIQARVPHRLLTDFGPDAVRRHLHLVGGGHYAQKNHATLIAEEVATFF